ncbi:hypothetical protein [Agriterribacter sp.]|uniref:hypothetical protein n=1 Tax=Agriterribacter sp. TaxID=2821509 RepID=UPI002BAE6131|nr:hypothetical protein [Agriterribacter sp.]HRP55255.1 hypothetical protein [Agriterribacter sp.]
MRCLLYVSCWLICAACSSSYKKLQRTEADPLCISAFRPAFSRALYHAQVNVTGKHLSGLLIIKAMPDSSIRMVFSSEAGFKFFDFEFDRTGFKVHYIYSQMNKKAVIKTLRKDFELLLMQHLNVPRSYTLKSDGNYYHVFPDGRDYYYYITDSTCTNLLRMERGSRKKRVVEAIMHPGNDGMPDTIGIKHHNFNFDIGLKRLRDDTER